MKSPSIINVSVILGRMDYCVAVGPLFLHGSVEEIREFGQQIIAAADNKAVQTAMAEVKA